MCHELLVRAYFVKFFFLSLIEHLFHNNHFQNHVDEVVTIVDIV